MCGADLLRLLPRRSRTSVGHDAVTPQVLWTRVHVRAHANALYHGPKAELLSLSTLETLVDRPPS